jgi:proteasome lid subunit RPN8/RPN11
MLTTLLRRLRVGPHRRRAHEPNASAPQPKPRLLITQACLEGLREGLAPEIRKGHEGIVYLLGRTDGSLTLAVTVFRPDAQTTSGSFFVDARAMAVGVRLAARLNLQIVAQVHTHPKTAFHSDGDVEGAKIRYAGYSSLVIPEYGRHLPRLDGAAVYMFRPDGKWIPLGAPDVIIVPSQSNA